MKTIDYLRANFPKGAPIFFKDIPLDGVSEETMRKRVSLLVKNGELTRVKRGLYYIPFKTRTGLDGAISIQSYIDRRYMTDRSGNTSGYISGLQLANKAGITTQNSAVYEIASNAATTRMRREKVGRKRLIIKKPAVEINGSNVRELQFLDLLLDLDRYAEISGPVLQRTIREFAEGRCVNYEIARKYVSKYPSRIYKNIIAGGMANELVRE